MSELKIGEVSKPRFEFRSFGQNFDSQWKRMSRLSVPVPEKVWERESDEVYIISRTNDINNTKIRDGKMDIKTYVKTVDGLEQWNPLMKGEFPIAKEVLGKRSVSGVSSGDACIGQSHLHLRRIYGNDQSQSEFGCRKSTQTTLWFYGE